MSAGTRRPVSRRGARRRRTLSSRISGYLGHPEAPYFLLLGGFTLVGLYLRFDRLGAQSLWFDEADMVILAQAPLKTLLGNFVTAGQNGPLYTLLLHFWIGAVGSSEVAVRLPSALAGTLTIPLLYLTGRALHGPKLGLYAAGIFAIAPYQQWYAQEAKMYALVVILTLLSTLFFLRALRDNRVVNWAAYALFTTLALYVHVTAALIMAGQILYFAVWGRRELARGRRAWLALSIVTAPYLPLAFWESRFLLSASVTWHPTIDLVDLLRVSLTKFAANRADPRAESAARWLFGGLAGLGLVPAPWRHAPWPAPSWSPRRRSVFLGLSCLLPIGLFYVITLAKPLFSDRYLIVATPAFILLVAGGILFLERYVRYLAPVALAGIIALSWAPLRDINLAGHSEKEDWRATYQHIGRHLHPRDAIVIAPGYLVTTLDYYRQQPAAGRLVDAAAITVPADLTAGAGDQRVLDLFVQQRTAGFERVWLVISPDRNQSVDPTGRLREWFTYNARLAESRTLNGVWYGLYTYNRPFAAAYYPPPPVRSDTTFGRAITLTGYGYDYFPDQSAVPSGGFIPLVLRWTLPPDRPPRAIAVRWRMVDASGRQVAGGTEPLFGALPLGSADRPGDIWDYHDLPVPATTPPGPYRLEVDVIDTISPSIALAPERDGLTLPSTTIQLGWVTVSR